jgi:hypothetical protein
MIATAIPCKPADAGMQTPHCYVVALAVCLEVILISDDGLRYPPRMLPSKSTLISKSGDMKTFRYSCRRVID